MQSKYQRWYDDIVLRSRARTLDCYKERHHILPRSLGGNDEPSNLVDLTYREHFLVHWLLTKIYDGEAQRAMIYVLHCMTMPLGGRIVTGWQFEIAKRVVKAAALKRADERRRQWKSARKAQVREIEKTARGVVRDAPSLRLKNSADRQLVTTMTAEWMRAERRRLARFASAGYRRHRPRKTNVATPSL